MICSKNGSESLMSAIIASYAAQYWPLRNTSNVLANRENPMPIPSAVPLIRGGLIELLIVPLRCKSEPPSPPINVTITVEVHGDTPIYHSGSMQRPKLHTPSVSNAPQQLDIRPFPRTRHPLEPGIVAGARDPQVLTQSFYGVSSLV